MIDRGALVAAWQAGRSAELRAPNPYNGQGAPARLWRLGYQTMLLDRMNSSPARQAFRHSEFAASTIASTRSAATVADNIT